MKLWHGNLSIFHLSHWLNLKVRPLHRYDAAFCEDAKPDRRFTD